MRLYPLTQAGGEFCGLLPTTTTQRHGRHQVWQATSRRRRHHPVPSCTQPVSQQQSNMSKELHQKCSIGVMEFDIDLRGV